MADLKNDKNIPEKFLKPYDPSTTEKRIYEMWEKDGLFNSETCIEKGYTKADAKPFTIMMPPPNVTGVLHMGHAMMLTIEDIMIRYKRMQGFRTLWLPGTDHAAIATQSKVEKEIQKKEGKSRHDLGREELLSRVRQFAKESHDTIASQVRVMGSSCDWSREAFTLDEPRNIAVNTMFKKMYDDGLIYRGHRIVNWDPKGQTTIADDEIVYEERKSKMYTFKYSKDFPISISTTRPETKVGDTAVAVHPDDPRYKEFVGKTYEIKDFCGVALSIKIVADEAVEKDFGTGALGVTPAHSVTDWEISERHNLARPQVINEYAKMMVGDERILGKKTTEAREVIVEWLRAEGLLENEEEITQNISTAERTGGIVEPLPKLQWFINVNKEFVIPYSEISGIESGSKTTLKQLMKNSVESGQIKIIPEYFTKTYFHWIDNLRDWCISRQIWYGHRVPVWYSKKLKADSLNLEASNQEEKIYVGINPPDDISNWEQDPDTLDTWFSSGLWTFSTLGWPEKTKDLEIYHPTDVLETGYDILPFWVARMILMTTYGLGTIPFKTAYLHGLVRDAKGEKMSKSLGNALDPLDIAEKFGADAGRMALVVGTAPGTDSKISEDKIKGYKHFANKIWNITRFVLENTNLEVKSQKSKVRDLITEASDKKHLEEFEALIEEITKEMDEYKFHLVAPKIYDYVWKTFADKIIEELKPRLSNKDDATNISAQALIYYLLTTNLRLLHPFIPFVTEEIWQEIHGESEKNVIPLIVAKWPGIVER